MAGADGSIIIKILGDDTALKRALGQLESVTKKGLKAVTASIGAASAALGGLAVYAAQVGSEFETSLAKVGTIADTSVKSLDELSSEVIALSNETGTAASELNEALYSAISAGADTAHATDLVNVAVEAARGGFTDTETAVDGLTSALNAYGMATTDAEGLANKFLVTQNLGKTTFGELASSIGTVAPTANAAGVSVDDLLASVAALTANGIGTSEAMTGMKAALSNVIKPTAEAAKMADQLGIDFSAAALKAKGWAGFLEEVREKTGGDTEKMSQLFGSVEALNSVMTLTSDQGMTLMNKTLGEMETNSTALEDAYTQMSDTFAVKTQMLKENLNNLGIAVYQGMQEPMKEAASAGLAMVQQLSDAFSAGGFEGLVASLGDVLAQLITNMATAAPRAIEMATQLIQALLQGIQDNAPALAQGAIAIVGALAQGLVAILPQLMQTGMTLVMQLAQGITQAAPTMVPHAVEVIGQLLTGLGENLDQIMSAGIDMIVALEEGLIDALPQLIEQIPQIVISIADAINNNAGKLLIAAGKLILELGVGLIKAIPTLIQNIPKIIEAIVKAFLAFGWLGLGKSLIKGITNGIKAAGSFAKTSAEGIGKIIQRHFEMLPAKLLKVGKDIVKGIANGIKSGAKWAIDAIKNLGKSMLAGIKDFFGIHSPSKVMADEIGKNLALGTAEGIADNAAAAVKAAEEMSQQLLAASSAWIEKKKFYNQLSTADEIAAWERVTQKEGLLAAEREQAERNLYTAKKALAEEQKKLYQDYQKDLEKRTSSLEGFAGLFDSVAEKSKTSGQELLQNLRGQVDAFKDWQTDIQELADRGISDALLSELREMGPKAASEIHALRQLTEDELREYSNLFAEKTGLATEQAQKEIGEFQLPITLTYDDTNVQADAQTILTATTASVDAMVQGVQEQLPKVTDITSQLAQCFVDTANSFRSQYSGAGMNMMRGVLEGVRAGRSGLINGIVSVLQAAVRAAKDAMDINSPSRVWADQIGAQMAAGAGVGFVDQMRTVSQQMQAALNMETAKMSAQVSIASARSASQEAASSRVETYYQNNSSEKLVGVKIEGDMAAFVRRAAPYIIDEFKRQGGNLVKGVGLNV